MILKKSLSVPLLLCESKNTHLIVRTFCLYNFRLVLRLWLDLGLSRGSGKWAQQCILGETGYRTYVCECVCVREWGRERNATSHANISASQAKTEDMPRPFIISQSLLWDGAAATHTTQRLPRLKWCDSDTWRVHINKHHRLSLYLFQSQSFPSLHCNLLNAKGGKDLLFCSAQHTVTFLNFHIKRYSKGQEAPFHLLTTVKFKGKHVVIDQCVNEPYSIKWHNMEFWMKRLSSLIW